MNALKKIATLFLALTVVLSATQLSAFASTIEQKTGDVPTVDESILTPQVVEDGDYKEATNSFSDGDVKYYLLTQDPGKSGLTEIVYDGKAYPLTEVKVVSNDENFANIKFSDGLTPLKTSAAVSNFTLFIDDGTYNDSNATNYTAFSHENASYVGLNEGKAIITKSARAESTTPPIAGRIERNIIMHKNVYIENLVFDGLNRDMLPSQYKQGSSTKKNRGEYFFNITGNNEAATDGLVMRNLTIKNIGDGDFSNDLPYSGWSPAPVKNVAINMHYYPGQVNLENIKIENVKTAAGYGTVQVQDGNATYIKNISVNMGGAHENAWPLKVETTPSFKALSMNQQSAVIESFSTSNVKKSEFDCIYVQDYRYEFIKHPSDYKYAVWKTTNGDFSSPAFLLYKSYPASAPVADNYVLHKLSSNYWMIDYGRFAVDAGGNPSNAPDDRARYIESELDQILKIMGYTKDHYSNQSNNQASPPACIILAGPEIPGFTVPDGYADFDTHIVAVEDKDTTVDSKEPVPFVDFDNGRTDLDTVSAINLPASAGKALKLYNFDFHSGANYTMHEAIAGTGDKVSPLTDPLEEATGEDGTTLLESANRYDTYYQNKVSRIKNSVYDSFVNCRFTVLNKEISITDAPADNKLELGTPHTLGKELLQSYTGTYAATAVDQIDDSDVIWVSSNPAVATIDADGTITPVSEGTVKIYLKSTDGYNQGEIERPWAEIGLTVMKKTVPQTSVTLEIPISKTVEQAGSAAPGAKTFEFEVTPCETGVDISGLTVTGATVSTDGAGAYTVTMVISGDAAVIDRANGLKITERNDGADGWSYDTASYIVYRDTGNGMLIQKDMGSGMNPQPVQTMEFINKYDSEEPTSPTQPGTVTVPLKKIVALGGSQPPESKTFAFEIAPYGNSGVDISGLTITGSSIETDGQREYSGSITITGDLSLITKAGGLKLTEKDDGAANWEYDKAVYIIRLDNGTGGMLSLQKDMGSGMNPQPVQTAEFTNTYTQGGETNTETTAETTAVPSTEKSTEPPTTEHSVNPHTGDTSNMAVWMILLAASCCGISVAFFCRKKKV